MATDAGTGDAAGHVIAVPRGIPPGPVHIGQEPVHTVQQERMAGAEVTGLQAFRDAFNIAQVADDGLPVRSALIIVIRKRPVEPLQGISKLVHAGAQFLSVGIVEGRGIGGMGKGALILAAGRQE